MLHPSINHSLVTLSGYWNLIEGTSQDRRQTPDEFAAAHRRIITDLYGKRSIPLNWRQDRDPLLTGFLVKELTFSYVDEKQTEMIEHHFFTLGRNEGREIRVKPSHSGEGEVMLRVKNILEPYQPGRDQNAVRPLLPKS